MSQTTSLWRVATSVHHRVALRGHARAAVITDIKMTEVKLRTESVIEQPLSVCVCVGGGVYKGSRSIVTGFKRSKERSTIYVKKKFLN